MGENDEDEDAVFSKGTEPANWTTNKENIVSVLANVKTPVGFLMAPLKHFYPSQCLVLHDHHFH